VVVFSMHSRVIVVGAKYRPDSHDKDLFVEYELDFVSRD